MRPVAELIGRGEHLVPTVVGHARRVAHDEGDEGARDACFGSDVVHSWLPHERTLDVERSTQQVSRLEI